jgi:large subunit ribosomal protein L7/L12
MTSAAGRRGPKPQTGNGPKPVLERVPKEQTDAAKEKLEAAGATVEVK